jgi:hypothetical protein
MNKVTKYVYIGMAILGAAALVATIIGSAIVLLYNFIIGL